MSIYQARRFFLLWMPVFLAGIALIAYSAYLTTALNGATILGTLVALVGLGAAARDNQETP